MSAEPSECPGDDSLLEFAQTGPAGAGAAAIEQHLAECSLCRRAVSALVRSSQAASDRPEAPGTSLQPGDVLDEKYLIETEIGAGGMGRVLRARHELLATQVVVKVLRPGLSPDATSRLIREARTAASLDHPGIARVLDAGALPKTGEPYIVYEHLAGHDLDQELQTNGPLSIDVALRYIRQASEALRAAHRRGIVHRDIKPANLFLAPGDDDTPRIKILDFGIAKVDGASGIEVTESRLTSSTTVMGSPRYMSPEQLASSRDVGPASDVWSLGVVLYEMTTGVLPFRGDTFATLSAAILTQPPHPPPDGVALPRRVQSLLERCLEKEPERRLPDADALVTALDQPTTDASPGRRRTWAIAVGGAVVVALGGAALVGRSPAPENAPNATTPIASETPTTAPSTSSAASSEPVSPTASQPSAQASAETPPERTALPAQASAATKPTAKPARPPATRRKPPAKPAPTSTDSALRDRH